MAALTRAQDAEVMTYLLRNVAQFEYDHDGDQPHVVERALNYRGFTMVTDFAGAMVQDFENLEFTAVDENGVPHDEVRIRLGDQ